MESTLHPSLSVPETRDAKRDRYYSQLFTQLIIHGVSVQAANERALEAADVLYKNNREFPTIIVG